MRIWLGRWRGRVWTALALLAAAATCGAGVARGTYAAGGSDSYCYVSQASAWLDGSIARPQVMSFRTPWPDAASTLAPAGYVPSSHIPGGIAPICPPGFGVVMAAANAIGGVTAVYSLVPIFGGLLVWFTFVLGRSLGGELVGAASALLTAASPIVLYQVVQPMSDIPAASAWAAAMAALVVPTRGRLIAAGAAAALAVMIRPNLAPALLVVAAAAWWHPDRSHTRALPRVAWFAIGTLPFALATAWAHDTVYGSPLRAGYGSLDQLFSLSHVAPNVVRYAQWLTATHTPLVWLAVPAPLLAWLRPLRQTVADDPPSPATARWLGVLLAAFAASVVAAYLPYTVFEDWWYLRFLLPAIPLILTLAVYTATLVVEMALRQLRSAGPRASGLTAAIVATAVALMAVMYVRTAADRSAFGLWRSDRRFVTTGDAVARLVPPNGVVWSAFHSGNVRLYGHRPSVLWDSLSPQWLDRAVQSLTEDGRESFLVLDSFEEPAFRQRFEGMSAFGSLDWPPRVEIGNVVKIWAFADRARFLAGDRPPTQRIAVVPRAARGR